MPSTNTITVKKHTAFQRLRRMRKSPDKVWLSDTVAIPDALASAAAKDRDGDDRLVREELGPIEFII